MNRISTSAIARLSQFIAASYAPRIRLVGNGQIS